MRPLTIALPGAVFGAGPPGGRAVRRDHAHIDG